VSAHPVVTGDHPARGGGWRVFGIEQPVLGESAETEVGYGGEFYAILKIWKVFLTATIRLSEFPNPGGSIINGELCDVVRIYSFSFNACCDRFGISRLRIWKRHAEPVVHVFAQQ